MKLFKSKKTILFITLFVIGFSSKGSFIERTVAILDVSARNEETNISYIHAAEHILKVAGVPYIKTNKLDIAFKYQIVLASSKILGETFSKDEIGKLKAFVSSGGIYIFGNYSGFSSDLSNFLGVSKVSQTDTRKRMTFDTTSVYKAFRWINDPNEVTISIGGPDDNSGFQTRGYSVDKSAVIMAKFDDGKAAIIRKQQGKGFIYLFGITFRDMIASAQVGKDHGAERTYSNGFEPSGDAIILFIKGIITQHTPFSIWKHTIPDKKKSSLMITHDVDSQTGMDLITHYSTYEKLHGIVATYNITARYFTDYLMGPIFLPAKNILKLDSAHVHGGHVLASHSIGHFPDMFKNSRFPDGKRDFYTKANYHPFYDGVATKNGTLYGETQLSKNLIEEAFHVKVRTWRSGGLCFPDHLNNLLDTLGYAFNSTNSANDVLTSFPFRGRTDRSNEGVYTNVLEIPMTLSDIFSDPISATNYEQKVKIWKDITERYAANYTPVVILIHPNRTFKLDAEKSLIKQLSINEYHIKGMEDYGDFWNYRDSVSFNSVFRNDTLIITIPDKSLPIKRKLGFVIDNGQALNLKKIVVQSDLGKPVSYVKYNNWYEKGIYIQFESTGQEEDAVSRIEETNNTSSLSEISMTDTFYIENIFPNPTYNELSILFHTPGKEKTTLKLINSYGKTVFSQVLSTTPGKNNFNFMLNETLEMGIYTLTLEYGGMTIIKRVIKI